MSAKKIVDCFTFFNELDLLSIRLEYLYDTVDYFVIVEADQSFTGIKRGFVFSKNQQLFEKYKDKIIYLPIQMKTFDETKKVAWKRETYQRNCIKDGLSSLPISETDLVLIGDIDEIPNKDMLSTVKRGQQEIPDRFTGYQKAKAIFDGIFNNDWLKLKLIWLKFRQKCLLPLPLQMGNFLYFVNYREIENYWNGTVMVENHLLSHFTPNQIRNFRKYCEPASSAGWHFSYLGGVESIKDKLKSYSHQEYNRPEIANDDFIQKCIQNGSSLHEYFKGNTQRKYKAFPLDSFPDDLQTILKRYPKLLHSN